MQPSKRRTRTLGVAAASGAGLVHAGALAGGYAGPVVTPMNLDFGNVAVNSTSTTQTLTVEAAGQPTRGPVELEIDSLTFPPGFARNGGSCPDNGVAPNPCTIGVVFQPTGLGAQPGSLDVAAFSFGLGPGTTSIAVAGSGVAGTPVQSIPTLGDAGLVLLAACLAAVAAYRLGSR